ncbi:Seprase [Dactylella cylindrospora]|nr:Seprase [Dactylella cylindrospora]
MATSATTVIAPYGTWESPISVEELSSKSLSLQECGVSFSANGIYHIEGRPAESGRSVICYTSLKSGATVEVIPKDFSSRSTVHEYGGSSFKQYPDKEAFVFTTPGEKKGVYRVTVSEGEDGNVSPGQPAELVPGNKADRYGNFSINPKDTKWILAVKEDHTIDRPDKVVNTLVSIFGDPGTAKVEVVAEGKDFYSAPSWNPEGTKVAWLQWDHPDMPWTGSEVCIADWVDGKLKNVRVIAGKATTESICQPRWSPDGTLFFASDKTGYWQLYNLNEDGSLQHVLLPGLEEAEFAYAEWQLGWHSYDFLSPTNIVANYVVNATSKTILVNTSNMSYRDLDLPFVDTSPYSVKAVSDSSFTIIASTADKPSALYLCTISDRETSHKEIALSTPVSVSQSLVSPAQHITFPRISSPEPSTQAYAWYYAPQNPAYKAPEGTLPPLVISLHGGPTAHSTCGLSLAIQYWTSRGYAYAFVNYSGSTGYGRKFRDSLNSKWGVADVSDAADCAHYLVSQNVVDKTRIGIVGGSAGGYGVLQAICSYPDIWAACVSNYGISSLKALVEDTHKFESKYMDYLLWEPSASEAEKEKILDERSPLLRAGNIKAPVLLLQGVEDRVVPKEQAEEMAKVIKDNGGVVEVVLFEGEGHGWRKQETVVKAINMQEEWWRKYLVRA